MRNNSIPVRILGIDPGYERVGWAIIERHMRDTLISSGCIRTNPRALPDDRLTTIGLEVRALIGNFSPTELSIETLMFNTNQKTAMLVAAARGVIIYEARLGNVSVHEYNPLQIKTAVTGYGRAEKDQVIRMVEKLLTLPQKKRLDDEYDAIAAALTHAASRR